LRWRRPLSRAKETAQLAEVTVVWLRIALRPLENGAWPEVGGEICRIGGRSQRYEFGWFIKLGGFLGGSCQKSSKSISLTADLVFYAISRSTPDLGPQCVSRDRGL
jgi:hypothetical protein